MGGGGGSSPSECQNQEELRPLLPSCEQFVISLRMLPKMPTLQSILLLSILLGFLRLSTAGQGASQEEEEIVVDEEKVSYAKGSVCGYCEYCKVRIHLISLTRTFFFFIVKIHPSIPFSASESEICTLCFSSACCVTGIVLVKPALPSPTAECAR